MKIGILGDIILDKYRHGIFTKKNPENSGKVFRIKKEEYLLGGAGAVATAIADSKIEYELISVVGNDYAGSVIGSFCENSFILTEKDKTTPVKERFVCNGEILPNRFDTESTGDISEKTGNKIVEHIKRSEYDVLLISDYAKGCVSDYVLKELNNLKCDIIVDPGKGVPWDKYPKRAIIKANTSEARDEIDSQIASPANLLRFCNKENVVITDGPGGIYCKTNNKIFHIFGKKVDVVDVCGAGDMVLAIIGIAIANGEKIEKACELANVAASKQVQHIGVYR